MFYNFFLNFNYQILEIFHHLPTLKHFYLFLFKLLLSKRAIISLGLINYYKLKIQFINQKAQSCFQLLFVQMRKYSHQYKFVHKYGIWNFLFLIFLKWDHLCWQTRINSKRRFYYFNNNQLIIDRQFK